LWDEFHLISDYNLKEAAGRMYFPAAFLCRAGKGTLCGFLLPEKGFERGDKYDTESFIHDGNV
jgi:hypothetical protein